MWCCRSNPGLPANTNWATYSSPESNMNLDSSHTQQGGFGLWCDHSESHFLYQENRDHLDRALSIINNSRRTVLNAMAIAMDTHLSELNTWVISHHLGPHRAPFTICHVHFTHEQRKAAVCTNTSRTVTISNVTHGKSLTSPHCT